MAQYDDEQDDELEGQPVQLPRRSRVASPTDYAGEGEAPTVASPMQEASPITGELQAPAAVAAPHIHPALRNPDPYAEYNAKVAAPSAISGIHNPFLRGLAHVGDIAGSILAPALTAAIPGTTFNERVAEKRALGRGNALEKENEQELENTQRQASTESTEATTEKTKADTAQIGKPKPKEEDWEEFGKDQWVNGDTGNPVMREKNSGQMVDAITKALVVHIKNVAPTKPTTAAQDKQEFEGIVSKVAGAGLQTSPTQLDKSLDTALKNGTITQAEHSKAKGYQSANMTPGVNVNVHTANTENTQAIHNANLYYRWKDPASGKIVEGRGTKVPQGADAEPIGNDARYAQHVDEGKMSNAVQQSFNRIAEDVDKHPEVFDNAAARAIMATTLEQVDRTAAGFLVAGTGGQIPLPSGLGDTINTALQNNALDAKTAKALKDYIADYRSMKDMAVVMQMEMQGGKIGRGSQQVFNAIVGQLPNGSTPDSTEARRLVANFQQKQDDIQQLHRDDGKEKPYQMQQAQQEYEFGTRKSTGERVRRPKGGNGAWETVPQQH